MIITLASWWIPLGVTIISFVVAWLIAPKPEPTSYFPDMGAMLIGLLLCVAAGFVSLLSWLIWALVT